MNVLHDILRAGSASSQTYQASRNHGGSLRGNRRRAPDRSVCRVHAQHARAVVQLIHLDLARRLGAKPLEGPPLHRDTAANTFFVSAGVQRCHIVGRRRCSARGGSKKITASPCDQALTPL